MEIYLIFIMVIVYFYELIIQDVVNICMYNLVGNQRCFFGLIDDLLIVVYYDFREFMLVFCILLCRYYILVDKRSFLVLMFYIRKI